MGLIAAGAMLGSAAIASVDVLPAFASQQNTNCNSGNGVNIQVCPNVNACVAAQVAVLAAAVQRTNC